jgi:hypothetical protein
MYFDVIGFDADGYSVAILRVRARTKRRAEEIARKDRYFSGTRVVAYPEQKPSYDETFTPLEDFVF